MFLFELIHVFDTNAGSAIRVAAQWYQNHLGAAVRVVLITNDRENKRKAIESGIPAETGMGLFIVHTIYIEFQFSRQIEG